MTRKAKFKLDAGQTNIKNVKSASKGADTVQVLPSFGKNWLNKCNLNESSTERDGMKAPPLQQDGEWDDKSCSEDSISSSDSAKRLTSKTNAGQNKDANANKSINEPYSNVKLVNLSAKSLSNHDLSETNDPAKSDAPSPSQIQDENGPSNDNNVSETTRHVKFNTPSGKNEHLDDAMSVDDDNDNDNTSVTNNQCDDNEFDELNSAINATMDDYNSQIIENDIVIKGISVEIEFQADGNINHCITSITHFTMDLLKKWIQSRAIDGVWALDGKTLMTADFEDVQAWTIPPRIIKKKQSISAEMIFQVKTENTTYDLYENQKEFCDKYLIKVSTKRSDFEHVNKVGHLTGTHVKLASEEYYINDISKRLKLKDGTINIKKEHTYERGKRSKVLTVHVIQSKVATVTDQLSTLTNTRYQFISYRKTTSEERLASMHHNGCLILRGDMNLYLTHL